MDIAVVGLCSGSCGAGFERDLLRVLLDRLVHLLLIIVSKVDLVQVAVWYAQNLRLDLLVVVEAVLFAQMLENVRWQFDRNVVALLLVLGEPGLLRWLLWTFGFV